MKSFIKKLFYSYKTKSALFLIKSILGSIKNFLSPVRSHTNEPIVIVTLANDSYAMMLAAMLKSVITTHRHNSELHFYIMDEAISEENKRKILTSVENTGILVHWISLDDAFFEKHGLRTRYEHLPTTYYRFFIPYFLPDDVKKIIWLDSDVIVLKDISNLWDISFENNYILAVQDTRIPFISDTIRNYKALGMNPRDNYFNAGVLVIDMNRWRQLNLSDKIMQCIESNQKDLLYHDQYGLNVVLYKKWKSINPNWNLFPEFFPSLPYIIHYVSVKPTSTNYVNYNKRFFFHYLNLTPWKGWHPS